VPAFQGHPEGEDLNWNLWGSNWTRFNDRFLEIHGSKYFHMQRSELSRAFALCRPALLCAAAFSLVVNILMLTGSLYMMQIYDRVLSSQSGETLVFLTLIALGALAVMTLVDLARGRVTAGVGVWLEQHLGQITLERAIGDTIAGRDCRAEALRDLATLRGFMAGPALIMLFDMPWAPIYLALVYILHPTLGHVALAGTALLLGFAILNDLSMSSS
jgi:ABC-type protease/lipase transport system fused ATPase/permease subunit